MDCGKCIRKESLSGQYEQEVRLKKTKSVTVYTVMLKMDKNNISVDIVGS